MIDDLRSFIKKTEELGECKLVEGADWELEIGSIAEVMGTVPDSPMLLFDSIKGYPKGYRVLTNVFPKLSRLVLALGFPEMKNKREVVSYYRQKLKDGVVPVAPVEVDNAPVKENVITGSKIDLFKFPVPRWHALDGGRYIGTGDTVIMRDPDDGWVNLGTYRVQIHDKDTATVWIAPGQHGALIRQKYWDRGQSCPVVVTCGQDPLLFLIASVKIPWGSSEYEYVGWLRQNPVKVTRGPSTGIPIPATAEIALEGEIVPPDVETRKEGPFAEWIGYYASGSSMEAALKVKTVLHRDDPIILGCPPVMNDSAQAGGCIRHVALLWNELESMVPGIEAVWVLEDARGVNIPVVSVKQMFPGHAKWVAQAVNGCRTVGRQYGRFIIVVDEDIDPFNSSEVLFALASRCDPASAIDIVRGCPSSPIDATIIGSKRDSGDFTMSRALVLACKPYHLRNQFPPTFKLNQEETAMIRKKWSKLFTQV
ncbi:MAG: UbiD family decarboxylase [Chloroflexi bacterium]|nr:UbiD family decarboxylase [Chloroflexota bacterium]